MRLPWLTPRGWIVAILVGGISALLTTLLVLQVRHWRLDEQQLHEIVALIQQGKIQLVIPPQPTSAKKE